MIEIERKFRLQNSADAEHIRSKLESEYGELTSTHQVDEVYLRNGDSYEDFKSDQPVLRLRDMAGLTLLTYKRNINAQGDAVEHEVEVDSADIMASMLKDMDYYRATRVEKTRLSVQAGRFALMLDDVLNIGNFLEIELVAKSEEEIAAAELSIFGIAKNLGLSSADIELRKYDFLSYCYEKERRDA